MIAYLLVMILVAAIAAVSTRKQPHPIAWAGAFLVLLVFIGLRHKIGMDWNNYLYMAARIEQVTFFGALGVAEPGYALLLWTSTKLGLGVYGANFIGSAIFVAGLLKFCSRTPLPWISLVTALPMLVVVVSMSANRQTIAIGVLLWLVADWVRYGFRARLGLIIFAAMFHFSAAFFLVFTVLGLPIARGSKVVLSITMLAATVIFFQLSGGAEYYDQVYVSGQSDLVYSPGALMHVLLNGVPAALLLSPSRVRVKLFPTTLHHQLAWLALALVPLAFFFSTAAGRMTLYLFPVSMYVFSALPSALKQGAQRAIVRTTISAAMFVVLWYWLSFANSSIAYVPYENIIWMDPSELHL